MEEIAAGALVREDVLRPSPKHVHCKYTLTYLHVHVYMYLPSHIIADPYTCLPTYLHTYQPTCIPTYIPTFLPTFLPTYLPTYIPTYIPTCFVMIAANAPVKTRKQTKIIRRIWRENGGERDTLSTEYRTSNTGDNCY